jgi:hypothetical protein
VRIEFQWRFSLCSSTVLLRIYLPEVPPPPSQKYGRISHYRKKGIVVLWTQAHPTDDVATAIIGQIMQFYTPFQYAGNTRLMQRSSGCPYQNKQDPVQHKVTQN